MKKIYDELAAVQWPTDTLSEKQQKKIVAGALAQIEQTGKNPVRRRNGWYKVWRVAAAAAALCCLAAVGVAAAGHFLQPTQIAQQMQKEQLADLFAGENSALVEATQHVGDYNVTLLGLTSGENVTGYWSSDWENGAPPEDRSYAVLAIAHQDGTPMAELSDEGGDVTLYNSLISPVFASADCPLAQYNIFTMNGARYDLVQDGIHYILIETDTLEPFADKDPQLAVVLDSSAGAGDLLNGYVQDPATGAIAVQEGRERNCALFDLPIDETKADPDRAEALRNQWFGEADATEAPVPAQIDEGLQTLAAIIPAEVRAKGTLQSSQTVPVSDGSYGKGWYFDNGGFLAYLDGWDNPEQEFVQSYSDDGQVVLLTHHEDDTVTTETWVIPVA